MTLNEQVAVFDVDAIVVDAFTTNVLISFAALKHGGDVHLLHPLIQISPSLFGKRKVTLADTVLSMSFLQSITLAEPYFLFLRYNLSKLTCSTVAQYCKSQPVRLLNMVAIPV